MTKSIFEHRSIRKYKSDPVPENVLMKILEAASRGSNTGNMQVYSIIVSKDPKLKEELAPTHFNQPMVKGAPILLTFCADFNRFNKWCKSRKAEPGFDNFLSFVTAAVDTVIAAQNLSIEAEAQGLGLCYLGTTIYNADKIIDILELPKGVVPITSIALGYPDESPKLTDRLPLEAIVHYEKYSDYSQEDIDRLYSEKESLSENIEFVKENNKETLAQVFTDVRYSKQNNEHFSKVLYEVLNKQGFSF